MLSGARVAPSWLYYAGHGKVRGTELACPAGGRHLAGFYNASHLLGAKGWAHGEALDMRLRIMLLNLAP